MRNLGRTGQKQRGTSAHGRHCGLTIAAGVGAAGGLRLRYHRLRFICGHKWWSAEDLSSRHIPEHRPPDMRRAKERMRFYRRQKNRFSDILQKQNGRVGIAVLFRRVYWQIPARMTTFSRRQLPKHTSGQTPAHYESCESSGRTAPTSFDSADRQPTSCDSSERHQISCGSLWRRPADATAVRRPRSPPAPAPTSVPAAPT